MTNEERYREALLVLAHNLLPNGFDFRPVSSNMAARLARVAYLVVLDGRTSEEAIAIVDKDIIPEDES